MRQFVFGLVTVALLWSGSLGVSEVYAQEAHCAVLSVGTAPLLGILGAVPADLEARLWSLGMSLGLRLCGLIFLFLVWVRSGEWVNHSSQLFGLGYRKWNAILFFPFAILLLGSFFIQLKSAIIFPVLSVVYLATFIPYVIAHNRIVEPHKTVFTRPWWRHSYAAIASKIGIQISAERQAEYEKGAQVDLIAMGAEDHNDDNANLITARHSPGYLLLKELIADMVLRRSEKMLLDYSKEGVNVRHEIDGVWHAAEPRDRESGDVMLAVIKTLTNLSIKERSRKQSGQFGAKYEGKTHLCAVVSQGVATGERVVLTLQGEKRSFGSYSDLGMREGLQKKWSELMALDQGLLILSTLPAGGLTTITNVSLDETDRLMRDFAAIEEVSHREADIQNVNVTTYDAAAEETPASILPKLIRTYPNVYVARDLVNSETAELLFSEIRDERLVISNVRARDATEALLRMLQKDLPAKDFAAVVTAVLYQRMIRLLCPDCKVGFTPSGEALKKMGIPAGKVEQLYRPPKPEEVEKPCTECLGLGYLGRTGVFELLVVTDQMREILVKQPKIELLKKAARAAHHRSLQEEAIVMVAKGETSTTELMRILKTR